MIMIMTLIGDVTRQDLCLMEKTVLTNGVHAALMTLKFGGKQEVPSVRKSLLNMTKERRYERAIRLCSVLKAVMKLCFASPSLLSAKDDDQHLGLSRVELLNGSLAT